MDIFACLQKLLPDWQGVVWNNSYEGIIPNELETRPTPTLAELEAVWTTVQIEQEKAADNDKVKTSLEDIDKKSIRPLRELASQIDANMADLEAATTIAGVKAALKKMLAVNEYIRSAESTAQAERSKIK